ncbi:MAG: hypothetical protein ACFHWX_19580 [Bacteroidota bacterium]
MPEVTQEELSEEGLSKKSVITNSVEIQENKETDNNVSKFNYLFYFIYKYKYQDKTLIDQIEEKL